MRNLVPCPRCTRHVRALETSCPFCLASLADGAHLVIAPRPARRLGRLAMFTFGATLAASTGVAAAGCGSGAEEPQQAQTTGGETPGGPTTTPGETPTPPPVADAGTPTPPPDDNTPPDDGNVTTMYGGAPGLESLV